MHKTIQSLSAAVVLLSALSTSTPGWAQEQDASDVDRRAPVVLRPNEKAAMLQDMREYLNGLQVIFAALAKEDMTTVANRAQALGTINVFHTKLMFPTVSGVRFRELAALVHEDFEEIAADARTNRNPKTTLEKLSVTMKRCVSCHETFRITDKF
jgi:hypothetical protein